MPRVQPPRSSSSTDTGIMFNCFCKWSELKPPNSIPRGNQACFHHTGRKRVREPVTSTTLGTTQHVATLMPLTGLTSDHFVTGYKNRFNRIFLSMPQTTTIPTNTKHASGKETKLYSRKIKFHGIVFVDVQGAGEIDT